MGGVGIKGPSSMTPWHGQAVKSRSWCEAHFLGVFILQIKCPQDSLLVSSFPINDPCNSETGKSEEGTLQDGCHWQSHRGSRHAILVRMAVSNKYPKSHHSAVRMCVSHGTSPGTSRDKIQHYRLIVDRYNAKEWCDAMIRNKWEHYRTSSSIHSHYVCMDTW
jgi:hypothetical protein